MEREGVQKHLLYMAKADIVDFMPGGIYAPNKFNSSIYFLVVISLYTNSSLLLLFPKNTLMTFQMSTIKSA